MTLPPAVVIHGPDHLRLALAPGRAVTLLSAPGAALYAGALWWRSLVGGSGQADVLDCAAAPGRALEALACGCPALVLAPCPAWEAVAERALAQSALLLAARPTALDLAHCHRPAEIAAWLAIG